jgi:universal stress protein E
VRLLRLKTVLAATDLLPSSDAAVASAARLADAAGAKLHIAHVASERAQEDASDSSSDAIARIASDLERIGVSGTNHRVHVLSGDPPAALSALADQIRTDVIVVGRHRSRAGGESNGSVGGTAYGVVTQSLAPCLITSQLLQVPVQRAVVAIDTSETARGALLVALSWSSALRQPKSDGPATTLIALHVASGRPLSEEAADRKRIVDHELSVLKRGAGSWAGVSVEGATETDDDPVTAIIRFAQNHDADLLVLGTRGLSAKNLPGLGSVSDAVTRQLQTPVLLVPPAVWRNHAHEIDYF